MLEKEKKGLLYFLKPDEDFQKASDWLSTIEDLNGNKLKPLILNENWWKQSYVPKNVLTLLTSCQQDSCAGLTGVGGSWVVRNFKEGSHDYNAVLELVYQSNPDTLLPVLQWKSL